MNLSVSGWFVCGDVETWRSSRGVGGHGGLRDGREGQSPAGTFKAPSRLLSRAAERAGFRGEAAGVADVEVPLRITERGLAIDASAQGFELRIREWLCQDVAPVLRLRNRPIVGQFGVVKTRPRPVERMLGHLGAHGIAQNVADDCEEMLIALHRENF